MFQMKTNYLQIITCFFFIAVCYSLNAQNGPAERWSYYFGGSKNEHASNVLECSDGGFLVTGFTESNDGQVSGNHGYDDAWIVKRKSDGTLDWKYCFGSKDFEYAVQATEASDGYVVIGRKGNSLWVFKISKAGSLLWERLFKHNNYEATGLSITTMNDGTMLLGGIYFYWDGIDANHAILIHVDRSANEIKRISSSQSTFWGKSIDEIKLTPDGNIAIMGNIAKNEEGCFQGEVTNKDDTWIAKLNFSFSILWSKTYGGTTADYFLDGDVTSNNEFFILGRTMCKGQITGPNNIGKDRNFFIPMTWLAKINSSGNLIKAIYVNSEYVLDYGQDYNCLCIACDNTPVLGGSSGGFNGTYSSIVKYDNGLNNVVWSADLTGSIDNTRNLYDIIFLKDAGYAAAGVYNDFNNGGDNYFMLRTEKDPNCSGTGDKCVDPTPIGCGQTYYGTTLGRQSKFRINDYNSCFTNTTSAFDAGDQLFVIYKPNSTGDLVITLFSTVDHDIFLLSNCNPVQCIDKSTYSVSNGSSGPLNEEIIRINKAPAGYYYLVVDSYNSSQEGSFALTVNCGTLDCGNAKPIGCKEKLVNETNQNGFNYVSIYGNPALTYNPSGGGCTGKDKVYTFLLNSTQSVTINLTNIRNANNDFELYLFKDCNEDVILAKSTNAKGVNEKIGPITLSAGRYYIVVDGWRESEGNYDLDIDWNCCNNPLEVYNCGYVTYKYSGNGSNLQFTFSSNKAIAPGKKWKVGANEINLATGTSFTYNFPSQGEYIICFPYLNANNCVEYCCYRVWISNPFQCFEWDYKFNPTTSNYTFSLDKPGASYIIWQDDTGGGNIGGGPISNPYPIPPSGCVERTITVTYFWNNRWYICCRKIWICNPFSCYDFDYKYDPNSNAYTFNLNASGASNILWQDDTSGGDLGGGPVSNPLPVPPNPGGCIEKIITVKYFWNNRWYICCRRVWICNPFDCLEFGYRFDKNSKGYIFNLNASGASNVTWQDDTGGGGIGSGPISNPVPVPPTSGGCVEKIITAKYFWNNRWYSCCRRIWLCDPQYCAAEVKTNISLNGNVIFSVDGAYQDIKWFDQSNGNLIGSGNNFTKNFPYNSNQEVCVEYKKGNQYWTCCKKFNVIVVSTETELAGKEIHLFPNPVMDELSIESKLFDASEIHYEFINAYGISVEAGIRIANNRLVNLSTKTLIPGMYFLRIECDTKIFVKRFIKA